MTVIPSCTLALRLFHWVARPWKLGTLRVIWGEYNDFTAKVDNCQQVGGRCLWWSAWLFCSISLGLGAVKENCCQTLSSSNVYEQWWKPETTTEAGERKATFNRMKYISATVVHRKRLWIYLRPLSTQENFILKLIVIAGTFSFESDANLLQDVGKTIYVSSFCIFIVFLNGPDKR